MGSCPNGEGVFGHRKRSFSKKLCRVDLFENAVFLFSFGRVKTELSKSLTSQCRFTSHQSMRLVLWEYMRAFCLPFFFYQNSNDEYRLFDIEFYHGISNFECRGVFMWSGHIFENTPRLDTGLFIWTKRCVFQNHSNSFGCGVSSLHCRYATL